MTNSKEKKKHHFVTDDEALLASPNHAASATAKDAWRVLRIMGEFVEGFESLSNTGKAVTIFGSARVRPGDSSGWYEKTVEVARHLGEQGFSIITGGGPGIMEAANKGAHEAGAPSIGLNIELPFEQHINPYVDTAINFRYFFTRKVMLVKYAHAFVVMPGGFGTMDELFEALTLIQTGKVRNFPIILYGSDYWGGLIDWLRTTMLAEGRISAADMDLLLISDSPEDTCEMILSVTADQTWREEVEESARDVTRKVVGQK